jgi:hypothetical protein
MSSSADAIDWTFHALTGILPMPMACAAGRTVLVACEMIDVTTEWHKLDAMRRASG